MVGIGVILPVGNAGNYAELLTVLGREFTRQALGRCSQNTVIVMVALGKLIGTVAHIGNDAQPQRLRCGIFAVMLAGKCHQRFGQTDETDTQRALVDDRSYRIVGAEIFATGPQHGHQQRELLGESGLLEVVTVVQLAGSHFEYLVELGQGKH